MNKSGHLPLAGRSASLPVCGIVVTMCEPGGGNGGKEPPPENRFAIFDLPARGRWNGAQLGANTMSRLGPVGRLAILLAFAILWMALMMRLLGLNAHETALSFGLFLVVMSVLAFRHRAIVDERSKSTPADALPKPYRRILVLLYGVAGVVLIGWSLFSGKG
jgi:hypothetical protein